MPKKNAGKTKRAKRNIKSIVGMLKKNEKKIEFNKIKNATPKNKGSNVIFFLKNIFLKR